MCTSRTNIDLDDELVAVAMRRYGLRTKKEVVDLALRRLVGPRLSPELVADLEGSGWAGDLEAMRRAEVAVVAARSGATLVHRDRDFDVLDAALPDLQVRSHR